MQNNPPEPPLTLASLLAALQDASRHDGEVVAACVDLLRRRAVVPAR